MYSILFLGIVSFLLSLVLTPVVRNRFRRWGMVDRPDAERKHHAHPVPRVGGIPLAVAYIFSFALLALTPLSAGNLVSGALPFALRLLPAILLIFETGFLDDLLGLKPWQKLVGQLAAAGAAYWAGVHVQGFGGHHFAAWLSLPLTLLWLVLCTNAVNLIDGVDGLAAGVGLFAAFTMLLAALLANNFPLAIATVPLVGCLLGFLRYNFNPATIFLGDSGSLFVGFLLGCYGVLWSQKSATVLGMTAPLMALSIPLLDTALAIVRRFLRQKSIFAADRGHIHHRLLDRGLTPRKVALVFYALCSVAAVFSLCMASHHLEGLVVVLFCAAAWIGVQHLGYVEFGVAGRMFIVGAFRTHLNNQIDLRTFEEALGAGATPEDRWRTICDACRKFGFTHAELRLNGRRFEETLVETNGNPVWTLDIPLGHEGRLQLTRCFGESRMPTVLVPFAEALYKNLCVSRTGHATTLREAQLQPR